MKKFTKLFVGVFCALTLLATSTFAADVVKSTNAPTESWTLTLGGVGSTVTEGDLGTSAGLNLSVGRTGHLLLPLEAGVRQGVTYDGDSSTLFNTRVYADWTLFTVKSVDVFAGGNVGLTYGNMTPVWAVAPEVGARWWLKDDVAVLARAELPYNLTKGTFNHSVDYLLGFMVKF